MGIVVPSSLDLASIGNGDERAVVEAFRDRLSDDWLIFPNVGIAGRRDFELDVVLVHPVAGVAVIEVKGHQVELREGRFWAHDRMMERQPDEQARSNAYALRSVLRSLDPSLAGLDVEYGIAFPNTTAVRGPLPPDLAPAQVLIGSALDDPADAIDRLMTFRHRVGAVLGADGVARIAGCLAPDAELVWDDEARFRRARRRMDELCAQRVRALEPLDRNRKVIVTGGAGSGKTRLALAWAHRAVAAGHRALLTCFNEPLAEELRARAEPGERLVVGPFFGVALALDGMPSLEPPANVGAAWWDEIAVGHLHRHWPEIRARFDVVIVDEAQDFSPAWLAQLAALLDPFGPRRVMLLCDEAQGVFGRGFVAPSGDDGWTHCELIDNCRNTFGIASLLHRRLDGSRALAGPESADARWCPAADVDAAVEQVGAEIDRIEQAGYATGRILVATTHRATRDRLRDEYGFGAWEERDADTLVCENVQRMKGLEFDFVILVADSDVSNLLLYVGLSRAIVGFSLVGPPEVAGRLGLDLHGAG